MRLDVEAQELDGCCREFQFVCTGHRGDGFGEGRTQDSALGDDGGDVLGWSYIEGRVLDSDTVRRHLLAVRMGHFAGAALFDRDVVSVAGLEVDGGPGRGDVEGNSVLAGEDRDSVSADLVGGIAVGGDAVGPDDHGLDASLLHQVGGHVVAQHGGRDVVFHQLPRGQSRALEIGAGFVGEDVDLVALLHGGADDAEGGTVSAGGERAGVAVGEDGALLRKQFGPDAAEFAAVGNVFVVHLAGERDDAGLDLRYRGVGRGEGVVEVPDAADAPEEVDGSGAGGGEMLADDGDFFVEGGDGRGVAAENAERDAHGSGDADGHGSADDHVANDGGDLLVIRGKERKSLRGEALSDRES